MCVGTAVARSRGLNVVLGRAYTGGCILAAEWLRLRVSLTRLGHTECVVGFPCPCSDGRASWDCVGTAQVD